MFKFCNVSPFLQHSSVVKKPGSQYALEYFDRYHRPVYGDRWSSIRVALLSRQKYCVLVNNFVNVQHTVAELLCEGAEDILKLANQKEVGAPSEKTLTDCTGHADDSIRNMDDLGHKDPDDLKVEQDSSALLHLLPVRKVASEVEKLKVLEEQLNLQQQDTVPTDIPIVRNDRLYFPKHLRAFAFERGDVRLFEQPAQDEETEKLSMK